MHPTRDLVFSIVIAQHKREELCVKCINSVLDQDFPHDRYEVLVVDDGFTLSRCTRLSLEGTGVQIIQKPHRGVCETRNTGIGVASGDFVVFIDNDCIAQRNWLSEFGKFFTANPDMDGAGGQVLSVPARELVAAFSDYRNLLRRPVTVGGAIKTIITANACFRKAALRAVGLFDVRLSCGEDADISYQLLENGHKLGYCEAAIYHVPGSSIGDMANGS